MDQEREDYADLDLPPPTADSPAALIELLWQLVALAGLVFLIVAGALFIVTLPFR
jgi:hypothetical protein